jgi:hypothetical protein
MSEEQPQFAPGYYPDPNDPKVERYYDGKKWTDNRQPIRASGGSGEKEQEASGTIVVGYILAIIIPIVGFIIGLTQINKNRHGVWVVVVSVVAFVVWIAIWSASYETGGGGGYYNY